MAVLIIGADSKLARTLHPALITAGYDVMKTSRRKSEDSFFLELSNVNDFKIPNDVSHAIIIGGVTSYNECKNNYQYAHKINCESLPKLADMFFEKKIHTCFISTNTVFESVKKLPKEYDTVCPGTAYGSLKAKTETILKNLARKKNCEKLLAILRLTKNVNYETSPFNEWFKNISEKKEFFAFKDLYFAPIRFIDSSYAIVKIIERNACGIFHQSGEQDICYSDFAFGLLRCLDLNTNLVKAVKSSDIGVNLIYNHNITSLCMDATTSAINIKPIKLTKIYSYFKENLKNIL